MTLLVISLGIAIAVLSIGVLWLVAALSKLVFNRSTIDFDDMSYGLEDEEL
jgi:E3 ubiquitin-protein ligase DOA10